MLPPPKRQPPFPKTPPSLRATSSRYRVHSAPPTSEGRIPSRLPPIVKNRSQERNLYMDKPSTPDPDQVRRVLEQRIAQALSGPSSQLKQQMSSDEKPTTSFAGRKRSLIRSAAIGSEEMHLVPIDDEELAMLRSINRSNYSKSGSREGGCSRMESSFTSDALYKHEYEDKSSDEEIDLTVGEQLRSRRKLSMIRQEEQEELNGSIDAMSIGSRRESGIRNQEDRLTGMRHEKMRSSTKSGDMGDDQISGLVYDKEFDCYYNPNTDRYYRLKSQSKSGEGLLLQEEV
ncbi:Protein CBG00646 [Caenorhabditis briggsae]|uniref:Uncharacterized protein n=2 Tax=Caenorhabditis briggsae TaxID=6238 RepID=A0AAE9DI02_CAEBR|nr:Protein CBG00646 [Caenorhabditis briggsae]ULU04472.1 hypothetical protein L3Y34_017323 [Caenorhabditis briggsae]CAP21991.1 Protein CBG00646 [Caenorhabditis briggsae]